MSELQKKHVVDTVTAPMSHTDRSQRATRSPPLASLMPASRTPKVQAQPAGEQSPLILPDGKFVTTLTLNSRTCRWPVGDPTELGFHYCGHSPSSHRPYCDAHDLKGYQPVRSRAKPPPQPQ
jgi:GcrA cell cycle regulator